MKRIISSGRLFYVLLLSTFTVFFTGCNGRNPDIFEVPLNDESEVGTEIETFPIYDEREIVSEDMIKKETVYFESQMDQGNLDKKTEEARDSRFDGVSGKPAFWFPEGHSPDKDCLKQFQVLGLINGTFYYYYITRPADSDTEIHAVVRFNYQNRVGKLLHERKVKAKEKEKKQVELGAEEGNGEKEYDTAYTEFYAQLFKQGEGYRICIYDDGNLILIDNQGKKLFSFTGDAGGENMRDIIRSVFDVGGEYYDAEVTDVITDGNYSFYIPVTLIKDDYTQMEDSEDDLTTVPYLFVYTFLTVDHDREMIFQDNSALALQEKKFQELAAAGGLRDAEADWKTATEAYPDQWGYYYLGRQTGGEIKNVGFICQWVDPANPVYSSDESGVPTTHPAKTSAVPIENIEIGKPLKDAVVLKMSPASLSDIHGVAEKGIMVKKTLRRSYKYAVEVTKTGEDGKTYTETEIKTASDSIDANLRKKITLSAGTFLNDYAIKMPNFGVDMVKGPVERDGSFRYAYTVKNECLLTDGQGNETRVTFPENNGGDEYDMSLLNSLDGHSYIMASDSANNRVYLNVFDRIYTDKNDTDYVIMLNSADLASKYRKGEADDKLFDKMEEIGKKEDTYFDFSETEVQDNPSVYTKDQVIVMGKSGAEAFLMTSFRNGMQLYVPSGSGITGEASTPGTVWKISDWPIYQAWPVSGSVVTAIGFDRTDTVYESMDIARARVYTFDINEIKKDAPFHKVPLETAGQE